MYTILHRKKPSVLLHSNLILIFFNFFNSCVTNTNSSGTFRNGVVVSTQKIASDVGAKISKQGGNAVNAAVAVSYALSVTYHPRAGNIGGGGFMVIRLPDGSATTIDYREKAPGRAHRNMYLGSSGEIIPGLSTLGALSVVEFQER